MHYVYEAAVGGKIASIGGRLLDGATRVIIGQFFLALARKAGGGGPSGVSSRPSLLGRLTAIFGGRR
jgi:2-furoyl-CoA dehydrogenase large subunit